MGFPELPYVGEVYVYKLWSGRQGGWSWPDCEIAFMWDGVTWDRDDEMTALVREAWDDA